MARHSKPRPKSEDATPPAPCPSTEDIISRERHIAEQALHECERSLDDQRERDRRAKAGNRVDDLSADYRRELKHDKEYLFKWVKAMADYKALIPAPAWPDPNTPPAEAMSDHGRDAWKLAASIFLRSDSDPAWAVKKLAESADASTSLAASVADWLRRGIRRVCEPAPVVYVSQEPTPAPVNEASSAEDAPAPPVEAEGGVRPAQAQAKGKRPTIYWVGERAYQVGNSEPVYVTENEDCLLQAFLGHEVLDKPQLQDISGLEPDQVSTILKRLAEKRGKLFDAAIFRPGPHGKGQGYRAKVVDRRKAKK